MSADRHRSPQLVFALAPVRGTLSGALVLLLLNGSSAVAQEQATPTPAPLRDSRPATLGPFNVSLSWRTRAEDWHWFDGAVGNSHYPFWHSQLRVAVGQTRDRVDWLVEAEQVAILGLPHDAVAPAPL